MSEPTSHIREKIIKKWQEQLDTGEIDVPEDQARDFIARVKKMSREEAEELWNSINE